MDLDAVRQRAPACRTMGAEAVSTPDEPLIPPHPDGGWETNKIVFAIPASEALLYEGIGNIYREVMDDFLRDMLYWMSPEGQAEQARLDAIGPPHGPWKHEVYRNMRGRRALRDLAGHPAGVVAWRARPGSA